MPKSKYSTGLEGQRFNRTVVVSFSHSVKERKGYRFYWNCLCDCGQTHASDARSMFRGYVQSCGCLNRDGAKKANYRHGHSRQGQVTREFTSWKKMRGRIDNPNQKWYHLYGGRGLRYCDGFREFTHFLNVIGPRPAGKTIDRIDNNGHYSCGECQECLREGWTMNVRWATVDEQNGNKRNTVFLTFREQRLPLFWWAKRFGLTRHQLYGAYRKSEASALDLLASRAC